MKRETIDLNKENDSGCKIPKDNIFIRKFLDLYYTIDKKQIDINKLKNFYPNKSSDELAEICINNFAKKNSFWGGISAMPGCIPGSGTIVQIGSALADSFALIRSQILLILEIGNIYGYSPDKDDRIEDVIKILSNNENMNANNFRNELIKGGGSRIVKNILSGMGNCFCRRSIFRFLPFAGIFIGAGMNYMSTKEVGEKTIKYYKWRIKNCYE